MAEAAPLSMVDMDIEIHNFSPVAIWRWNVTEDSCGICMNQFDGTAPGIRFPGDDCAPVFGKCKHTFHMPCLMKWLEQQAKQGRAHTCPLCRADWEFSQYQSPARPRAGRGTYQSQLDFDSEPSSDDSQGSGAGSLPGSEAGGGGVALMADLASVASRSSMDGGSSAGGSISIDSPGSGGRGRAGASSGAAPVGSAAPASGRRGNSVGGARRVSAGQSVRWHDESPDGGGARGRSGGARVQGASGGRRRGRGAAAGGEAGQEVVGGGTGGGSAGDLEVDEDEDDGDGEDVDMDMSEDGLDTTEESS